MIYSSILDCVGNTPLVRLKSAPNVLLKLEKFNPGGSVKDRPAISMIADAEKRGLLAKGTKGKCKIVESSSGNLAVSLAMACAVKGYKFIAVVDENISQIKRASLQAYGADVRMVCGRGMANELKKKRRELVKKIAETENAVCLDQYANPANPAAHKATAREIIRNAPRAKAVVAAVSTGGQASGIGRALKEMRKSIRVVGVEPQGSLVFGGKSKAYFSDGSGLDYVPKNFDASVIDLRLKVGDAESFRTARFLARKEGILVGCSAARVVCAALRLSKSTPGEVVCVCADGGEAYPKIFE